MQPYDLTEKVLSTKTVFEGKIIRVETWHVGLPDGKQADREIVLHRGAAAIVALDEQNRVAMVRQHRVAINEITWEIPAGKLDFAQEDPLLCAKRELEEETGLRAGQWTRLAQVVTTPGFCTERIAIYLAQGLSEHAAHTDSDEFVEVSMVPLQEAVQRIMDGEIYDAKTCLGLLMAWRRQADQKVLPLGAALMEQVIPQYRRMEQP